MIASGRPAPAQTTSVLFMPPPESTSPDLLLSRRFDHPPPLSKLIASLGRNNANAGGAYLERAEQQSLIRGEGLITSLADIDNIVVGVSPTGTPILMRNVADVRFAPMVRQGYATQDGKGEIVIGVAMMLIGENSRVVADRVKVQFDAIQKIFLEASAPSPSMTVLTLSDARSRPSAEI